MAKSRRNKEIEAEKTELAIKKLNIKRSEEKVKITKKDFCIMAVITLIYALFAFCNLGSMSVPENGFFSAEKNETVTLELSENADINRIYFYTGWISRRAKDSNVKRIINIEYSSDGEKFIDSPQALEINSVFNWKHINVNFKAKYIRLSFDEPNFYINEVAVFGENESEKREIVNVISKNETGKLLFDEQSKVRYAYSWYDGTYFDEIYHPRTAYEYIHGLNIYENTHPPLGKIIISLGILIFGMNPFGWRFFGCLAGVLMVPISYIFAKKMFKKSFWSTICCVIFAFDFMHITQTRIATIDSYTALFVMCSFYFMYIFTKKSYYDTSFKECIIPLFLSGLFFGFSVSTKWQGFYAGVGLAIMFFWHIFKRYAEFLRVKKAKIKESDLKFILNNANSLAIKTILSAALFFVIVPAIVYLLSYIPVINAEESGLQYMLYNQPHMLKYHANLAPAKPHPYSSKWWSWPLDIKPLYLYSPNAEFISDGFTQKLASFGNPAIWWLTIPAILALAAVGFIKGFNDEIKVILIGFAAMYLPWVFVSREAFIYHFFPCVIFVVLGIVYLFKLLYDSKKIKKWLPIAYTCAVFGLFLYFYPVIFGTVVPVKYMTALKWLSTWPF